MADAPVRPSAHTTATVDRPATIATDGIVAGVIAALAVAVWFLVLDTLAGRPFHTPTVLGTALFRRGAGLESPETLPISLEMVGMFTWVHALVFIALGGVASFLLSAVERRPSLGFGLLLLFVMFQAGFTVAAVVVTPQVITIIGWIPILAANLLAASSMAAYLGWRHRDLSIAP
ncbi:MAG: hypothetical protein HYU51_13960 [Candidatus Rokubacteria bacterium]|nr:hypothetical protein [Candidatus Rokubacteria bacterium]